MHCLCFIKKFNSELYFSLKFKKKHLVHALQSFFLLSKTQRLVYFLIIILLICYCIYIHFSGRCVEFNVGGGVIQDQLSAPCNATFPKCDEYYISSDAYKCKVADFIKQLLWLILFINLHFSWKRTIEYRVYKFTLSLHFK